MALFSIPHDTMKALLTHLVADISTACPYAFLLKEGELYPLDSHLPWLREKGLLEPPSSNRDGGDSGGDSSGDGDLLKWHPAFKRAIELAAFPRHNIQITEGTTNEEPIKRALHASNGREVVYTMFDQKNCLLSEPITMTSFLEKLLEQIGSPKEQSESPPPLRLDHKVVRLLSLLIGWNVTSYHPQAVGQARQDIAQKISDLFESPQIGIELIDTLLQDRLLLAKDDKLWFAPEWTPYIQALRTGEQLEIKRLDLENGQPPSEGSFAQSLLIGSAGTRCLVYPTNDGSHDVIFARPASKDLRALLAATLGDPDLGNASIQAAASWSRGATTVRG